MQSPVCPGRPRVVAAALVLAFSPLTHASCGAASCNLLNDRFALGTWEREGWSADLRVESITQDRLRHGDHAISSGQLPEDEEAVERHTRGTNLVTTLDYALSPQWSFALRLPLLHRDHVHDLLDEETGGLGARERWHFTRVGDVQALARWQAPASPDGDFAWALTGGLQLPTGSHDVANADGSVAERALQPGTGTTATVLGASARWVIGLGDALNLQTTWTHAFGEGDGYRPGDRFDLSAGWAHAMSPAWSLLLQANASWRGRDRGEQAEPDNSGSTSVSLSPGASVSLGHDDVLYGFVQVPILQHVNGVQLVPRASLAAGWTHSF